MTTPIYYVNDVPHIGHAYTTIAADVLARYHRQLGDKVFFLTGTDEHGNPAAQAAKKRGLTPQQHANEMVVRFQELVARVNATNDFFIRTTDARHCRAVQEFIQRLYDQGDIYLKSYQGLYCDACEAFYAQKDLVDGKCPDHGTAPRLVEEENYFFRLSAYQERLIEHFEANPGFVMPETRFNEAKSFISRGLEDISISRASLEWGIPIPWDESQVVYVWVDALLNYVTALGFAAEEDLLSRFWPADYHLMAKDILKFHAVIWPALLMAAGMEPPRHMFVHGYLLMGGQKMSKTRGNVLDPFAIMDVYGVDAFRFYCFREVAFGQDGVVSLEGFEARYNAELANELGNLLSRTAAMIRKYNDTKVPAVPAETPGMASIAETAISEFSGALLRVDLTEALEVVWRLVRNLNKFVEENAPWKLAKAADRKPDLDRVLFSLAEGLRICAVLLHSFMPETSVRMLKQLGQPHSQTDLALEMAKWGRGKPDARIEPGEPLFPKLA